nr:ferrochelatase-2, chloroplastic-like [Tanacetum cinerariifolium]
IHAVAPILSNKEPEYSPSLGYEHSNTTLETESDEIIKSGVEELVPILSENEVTLKDKREYVEYIEDSLSNPEIVSIEEENGVEEENDVEEEEFDLEDISKIQDIVLRKKLLSITRLISNIESLNENPTPDRDKMLPRLHVAIIQSWYQREGYVKSMADLIQKELQSFGSPEEVMIFFSAYGVPKTYVRDANDLYRGQMEECIYLVMQEQSKRSR